MLRCPSERVQSCITRHKSTFDVEALAIGSAKPPMSAGSCLPDKVANENVYSRCRWKKVHDALKDGVSLGRFALDLDRQDAE